MADIKMDFNGDVSIEKMFDIHNNQQVTIYNNSNTGKKEISSVQNWKEAF